MFYSDRCFECFSLIIFLLVLENYQVTSCAGTRIPRPSHNKDKDGWTSRRRDATKPEEKNILPRSFWLGCKDWKFVNFCCGRLADLNPDYIVYGSLVGVLAILIVDVFDYYLIKQGRSDRVPLLCQLVSTTYWLFCVMLAPLLYWPELVGPIYQEVMITRPRSPVSNSSPLAEPRRQEMNTVSTSTSPPTPTRRQKDKCVQTSGPCSKRYLKQAREYEAILTGCRHQRTAKLKKTARMLHQFRTKWKGYMEELECKNRLIDDALSETVRLERQVIFLHDACALLREQLKTQQTMNRGVLQRYQDMHKQILGYLGQTDTTTQPVGHRLDMNRYDSSCV